MNRVVRGDRLSMWVRSRDRAVGPRIKFFVADPLGFALRLFSAGYRDDLFKNLAANLLQGRSVEDFSGVDIHVVDHTLIHGSVCRDLHRWNRFTAETTA